jgi:hypothetical protein
MIVASVPLSLNSTYPLTNYGHTAAAVFSTLTLAFTLSSHRLVVDQVTNQGSDTSSRFKTLNPATHPPTCHGPILQCPPFPPSPSLFIPRYPSTCQSLNPTYSPTCH